MQLQLDLYNHALKKKKKVTYMHVDPTNATDLMYDIS